MSMENIDVVRRAFAAWNAGNMEGVRDAYDEDAVMRYYGDFPEPGPFFGREAIMRQFERLRDALDNRDSLSLLGEPFDVGDRVVAQFAWRGEGYGPAMDAELTIVYTVRQSRILEAQFFRDHQEALEAIGLPG
jgi:ketosteroid isomerase-like protein